MTRWSKSGELLGYGLPITEAFIVKQCEAVWKRFSETNSYVVHLIVTTFQVDALELEMLD